MVTKANFILTAAILCGVGALTANAATPGVVHGRVYWKNPKGGVGTAGGTAYRGPNGGTGFRGHELTTNGQGTATRTTYGDYKGANGSTFDRKSSISVSKDGAYSHQGTIDTTGKKGTIDTTGSYSHNGPGSGTLDRNTEVTGRNGNTYTGQTTWSKGAGYQHTQTCRNAAGATITCKY
jgi:hypothetical protein